MKSIGKDIAKVAAGFAASETLGHWWLGIWGDKLLPMDVGWFTFTREINQIVMIVWPFLLLALVTYAWGFNKREVGDAPSMSRPIPV